MFTTRPPDGVHPTFSAFSLAYRYSRVASRVVIAVESTQVTEDLSWFNGNEPILVRR